MFVYCQIDVGTNEVDICDMSRKIHFFSPTNRLTYNRVFDVRETPGKSGSPGAIERCAACFSPCLWSAGLEREIGRWRSWVLLTNDCQQKRRDEAV